MPGAMQLTVMPRLAASAASDFVMPISAGLRRGIIRLAGIAGDPDNRADRDHPPVTAPDHPAQCGARQPEGGGQIDVDDRLPILVAQPQRDVVAGNPGIVDEDIDPAHRRLGLAQQAVGRRRVGEIGRHDTCARFASSSASAASAASRVPASATAGPLTMQGPRDRAADAARGAGHQSGLSGQVEHHSRLTRASTSPGVPTEIAGSVRSIRLTRPARTRPAPISTTSSTSSAANA